MRHPSQILLTFCIAFLGGIFIWQINLEIFYQITILFGSLILTTLIFKNKLCLVFLITIIVGIVFSYFRFQEQNEFLQAVKSALTLEEQTIIVQIVKDPAKYLDKNKIVTAWQKNKNIKIQLTTPLYPQYEYGQILEVTGNFQAASSHLESYQNYLYSHDIFYEIFYPEIKVLNQQNNWLTPFFKIKNNFKEQINKLFSEPEAAFLQGLLLGEKNSFPKELLDKFNITGMTHIVALSGYNITIIASFFAVLISGYIKKNKVMVITILGILVFIFITGLDSSVVRAAIMGTLVLLAKNMGRRSTSYNTLALAAVIMVWLQPMILIYDIGFQLSFLATMGILMFSKKLDLKLKRLTNTFAIRESAVMSLSAQILVVPIILINFGNISLISPIANILLLAVLPIIMLTGFLATLFSFIFFPAGLVLSVLPLGFLQYEIMAITLLAKIPWASLKLNL
ncbi:MAG: ComEC/Rec2 family competence protein [bacterium]